MEHKILIEVSGDLETIAKFHIAVVAMGHAAGIYVDSINDLPDTVAMDVELDAMNLDKWEHGEVKLPNIEDTHTPHSLPAGARWEKR